MSYGLSPSIYNDSNDILSAGATFTGQWVRIAPYNTVTVAVKTDQAGTLYMEFSPDGVNNDSSLSFSVAAGVNEVHRLTVTRLYYRTRFTNTSGSDQTYFRLQTLFGSNQPPLTAPLNGTIQSDSDSMTTRSIVYGETDGGIYKAVPVTTEGHLEVAVHSPRLPFGSIHTENMEPEFQTDSVYGINPAEVLATTGINAAGTTSATITGTNNKFRCSTGTTVASFSTLQSRRRLRYRPGQGAVVRYTALFSTPAASSILVAGCGTAESGFYFGYNGTSFGILYSTGGAREIQTLTVTTASTATNNYVVTLADAVFNITATNNGSTTKTAYEIASGTYTGWKAEARGSTVIFLADSVGNKTGTFSLAQTGAATPAAGTFSETLAGASATDTWIPKASWNGDVCDGSGSASNPSGFNLDPSKGNVYQIQIQYLGFGDISFQVEVPHIGNNPDMITVHTINYANTATTTNVSQPSFPFTMAAYSAGSTTNVYVECASFAGFIEGRKKLTGPRMTFSRDTNNFVGSTSATYYPLFTIRNDYIHGHTGTTEKANQSVVQLLSLSASHDDATPVTFYLIRNAVLAGTPSFTKFSTSSCTYWDTAATTCTIAANENLIFAFTLAQNNSGVFAFTDQISLQPGETITLAARAVTGTATYVNASLNTREDQ